MPPSPELPRGFQQSIFKGKVKEGHGWLVQTSLVSESFVLAAVHVGQVTMFLKTSNKTNIILCSATLYLYMNEKCYALKGQSLENGLPCIFQAIGNILNWKQKQ